MPVPRFARDGLLPRALGLIYPRTQTPYVAILTYAALAMVLALTGTFHRARRIWPRSRLPHFMLWAAWPLGCWLVAILRFAGEPLNFRWLGVATFVGVTGMFGTDRAGLLAGNRRPGDAHRHQRARLPRHFPPSGRASPQYKSPASDRAASTVFQQATRGRVLVSSMLKLPHQARGGEDSLRHRQFAPPMQNVPSDAEGQVR